MTKDPKRYGETKVSTIQKRVNALDDSIRKWDAEKTEEAWDKLLPYVTSFFERREN